MIKLDHVSKTFTTADGSVEALKNVTIDIADGDVFGIIGMSGAGKSTLVRCINMLERPTEGRVLMDDCDLGMLSAAELREKRREITMIFQGFNLLMQKNCLKNVAFPLRLAGVPKKEAFARAKELLEMVGLGSKAGAYPAQLSGGQQQRVAIARALATKPKVLLCDEATSALDPKTTQDILGLIREINEKTGITVIIITHQMSVVESVCRHVAILDGGVVAEMGEVDKIFAHPESQAARRLVFPEGGDQKEVFMEEGVTFVRVVFNGAHSTNTPLIARMVRECGIDANITYASAKAIGQKMFGSMILSFTSKEDAARAVEFISGTPDVIAEEVKEHVQ